jgi:alkylation response protein AidB-like acyl-CoA dehydrogenase
VSDVSYDKLGPAAELDDFIRAELPQHRAQWGDDESFAARLAWQRRLASGGWVALTWPIEFGGRGLAVADQVQCEIVLARHGVPTLAGVLGVNNVGPTVMALGTPAQQQSLPAILTGDEVWCQGFSEPGAGSDLASLRTRAVVRDDHFIVDGQKIWTTDGMEATHCELMVRTDPGAGKARDGLSVLLVPLDLPGITRRAIRQIDGSAGFAELFFDSVEVPRDALLGELHRGWDVGRATLAFERTAVVGLAGRLREQVDQLVAGLTVGDVDEAVMLSVVDAWVDAEALGVHGERVLAAIDADRPPGPEQSVIKLAWSQITQRVGELRLDLEGEDAVAPSDEARRAYLRSRTATIAGGTTEIMKNMIADRVLRLPRR